MSLTKAATDGNYGGRDAVFFSNAEKLDNRLRARIHSANEQFAACMRTQAAKRRIVDRLEMDSRSAQAKSSTESENSDEDCASGQLRLTREQMMEWVKKVSMSSPLEADILRFCQVYLNNRGRELPGTYNQEVLSELFREQCSR